MCYGYALTLTGAATDEARPKIRKRALEFQRRLRKMQKAEASAA